MPFDLHTHSNVSDGTEPPQTVVRAAAMAGLAGLALTDHDSTAGWARAADQAVASGLVLIPGMEVSCVSSTGISVHLLSYLHDPHDEALRAEIERARSSRFSRAQRMVERLAEDYPITWDDVLRHSTPDATIGRPHIADALVAHGVVRDRSAAFTSILTPRSRYYVGHYAPDPVDAVRLVLAAGGVPVFAHPVASMRGRVVGPELFEEMIEAGLAGVEVDHRDNPDEGRRWLRLLARRHGLVVTGSSDYHGAGKPNRIGEHTTPDAVVAQIIERGTGTEVIRP
ncbi:PHP domain-containing protein [Citricoccus sp. SGAir0253]|uniref:PHP domain-containing protein n=1 Tax=Citricoccus sp. SGAir0253 TaxID=2567881 RepID=UPI0010CCFF2F|nr:PHP domain-containing protein [Citricoccus sp. SGAir0253]QCU77706.1 PHP domain-containing protein [Citricoccus sp. SGAir0253]